MLFPHSSAALTPPMGWNSYDYYDTTVTEADVRATAEVLARERRTYHSDLPAVPAAAGAVTGTLDDIVLQAIHQTLDAVGGNQTAAAKRLGISRTTLWRYLNPRAQKKG